jgi:endo-1,4-beta-xylanase
MKGIYIAFSVLVSLCIFSCKKNNTNPQPQPQPPLIVDTETLQGVAPFKIGAAIDVDRLKTDALYKKTLLEQQNSISIENAVKWQGVHPSQNTFDFSGGDYIADFAVSNNKRLHGHVLVWYSDNPAWLNTFSGDSLAWEQVFKTHIQTVVTHYKGKIKAWDVVNEAFRDDDGSLRVQDKNPNDNFDDGCIWARRLGNDYLARAFTYARQADPAALLFYNEYGQEWKDEKTTSIINMVNDFKTRGIPIDGIGIQMHIDINTSNDGIIKAIKRLAATGLLIHISELDIKVNPANDPSIVYTDALRSKQADKFAFVAAQYKALVPQAQQYGITTWNVGDKDSWIVTYLKYKDWPLMFDENYAKKSSYFSFKQALKN